MTSAWREQQDTRSVVISWGEVQEDRPTYVSCCKRLYNPPLEPALPAAGGSASDRLTAQDPRHGGPPAVQGLLLGRWIWVGVDPDTSLASGHSKMLMMLPGPKTRPESSCLPIEAFYSRCRIAFDIVTWVLPSPATNYNSSHQAHPRTRPRVLQETTHGSRRRALLSLYETAIFAFSCLDQKDVIYTEFMLPPRQPVLGFVQVCSGWRMHSVVDLQGRRASVSQGIPRAP